MDTIAGSRSYNRLDMQVSQTLHIAIELYDNLNFLLVLDHYDDITLFDLDKEPLVVSYYQMKTSENTITIDAAIKEGWLAKLHAQLNRPEDWLVKELGLITNTPLQVDYTLKNEDGKDVKKTIHLNVNRTKFTKLHQNVQDKIKKDIAEKCEIEVNQVDLSKFAHIRTTLTIERHKDLVELEVQDFLHSKHPRITVDMVKGIYSSLIDLLTKRQEYERIPEDSTLNEVTKHKGFTKSDFTRIIDSAIMLSIPTFVEICKLSGLGEDEQKKLSFPYVQILTDSNNKNDESFSTLYKIALKEMNKEPFDGTKTPWDYGQTIGTKIHNKNPLLKIPYNLDYIAVLTLCLLTNQSKMNS